jgi:hypothetical protein
MTTGEVLQNWEPDPLTLPPPNFPDFGSLTGGSHTSWVPFGPACHWPKVRKVRGRQSQRIPFHKTDVFKKGTVHKCRHCSIIDCRFSLNKRSELSKQYLQQGHCQLQIIKVGPWIFTMNVESRHSKSTTKSEVPEWFLRHQSPLMQSTNHYELALWRIGCTMADA